MLSWNTFLRFCSSTALPVSLSAPFLSFHVLSSYSVGLTVSTRVWTFIDFNVSVAKFMCMLCPAGYTIRLLIRRSGRNICTCMHKYWHTSHTVQILCTIVRKQHKTDIGTHCINTYIETHTQWHTEQNASADAVWLSGSDGHCCICTEGDGVVVVDSRTPEQIWLQPSVPASLCTQTGSETIRHTGMKKAFWLHEFRALWKMQCQ